MKLKFNRATTLIGFVLVSMLATSCGCGDTPEEKERKDLAAQEKQLMDKLKKHFKPEAWKEIEKGIKEEKNDLTKVDNSIVKSKHYLEIIEGLEKRDVDKLQEADEAFLALFKSLKEITPEIAEDLIARDLTRIYSDPGKTQSIFAQAKQANADGLALYENFKKQLGLKNKGKKPGDK